MVTRLPDPSDEAIGQQALRHLAAVLGVREAELSQMPWPKSELNTRQFEVIRRELDEVADEQLRREMTHGTLLVSLNMYCAQMARCSRIDPEKVAGVLGGAAAR